MRQVGAGSKARWRGRWASRCAAQAGCRLLDLEIESAESAGADAVAELRRTAAVIISFHDFQVTRAIRAAARRLRRFPADYYKLVTTATRQSDNCELLEFLGEANAAPGEAGKWLAFCMGEAGAPSRILALSRGSAFVYAAAAAPAAAEPSTRWSRAGDDPMQGLAAPGQLDCATLRERYRAERLPPRTALYGLLGCPVGHSIGGAVHNAAFRARRMDAVYLPLLASDLKDFRRAAERYPLAGFSVTIPHKQAILRYVERADTWVKLAGAANTVRVRRGRWEATNTDIAGMVTSLRKFYGLSTRQSLPNRFQAVIVGAGGAARAVVIALGALGCGNIVVTGRDPAKVRRFARSFHLETIAMDELGRERFDLLVHATPVGMWPNRAESLLQPKQICAHAVFDLIYNPPETLLLRLARAQGSRTLSGLEMFLTQAAQQFEYWTGEQAPLRQMSQAAQSELALMP